MHMKTTKMTRPNPSVLRVLVKKQLSTRKTLRTYLTRAAAGAKVTLIVTKFRSIYGPHGRGCKRAGVPMTSHLISIDGGKPIDPADLKNKGYFKKTYKALGTPQTAELTIEDAAGKRVYRPMGMWFMPRIAGRKSGAKKSLKYLPVPQIYLFDDCMYNTLDPKFVANVSKYSVIFQCEDNGDVGLIDPIVGNSPC
jgi:hypothetical protein